VTPEAIPRELVDILDAHAGKVHSDTGPVLRALAQILTRFQALQQPPGTTPYGFVWGPARVERVCQIDRGARGIYRVLRIDSGYRDLNVYLSPTGRSVRVFADHVEWVPRS
jgi:hypothetical protein